MWFENFALCNLACVQNELDAGWNTENAMYNNLLA